MANPYGSQTVCCSPRLGSYPDRITLVLVHMLITVAGALQFCLGLFLSDIVDQAVIAPSYYVVPVNPALLSLCMLASMGMAWLMHDVRASRGVRQNCNVMLLVLLAC